MTALKGLIVAAALAGSIALAGAKPAAAQGLTNEELVIGGLLIAGGLLLAEELTNDDDDHRDRWRDNRYRWRDERRFEPIPQSFPGGWIAPPAYQIVPPPPPGWYVVQNRAWPPGLRPGRGHEFKRGRGHDDDFRPGYGFGHRH